MLLETFRVRKSYMTILKLLLSRKFFILITNIFFIDIYH